MRWLDKKSQREFMRYKYLTNWHKWYAWYPVKIGNHYYWLEYIQRKCVALYYGDLSGDDTQYKTPEDK